MPHSIHVSFLSANAFSMEMIEKIIEKNIITAKNIHVSEKKQSWSEKCAEQHFLVHKDDVNALIKAEIAVITVPKREFMTVLAPITAITRGKIILAMSEGTDTKYVLDFVAKGTHVVSAPPVLNEETGTWTTMLEYSQGFPEYMRSACEDLVKSICTITPA